MMSETRRKYRIASPVRFFIFILILVMVTVISVYTIFSNKAEATATKVYRTVVVQQNDTLWSLADEYGPDDIDIRRIIDDICITNDISAGDLQPGQRLLIPVEL